MVDKTLSALITAVQQELYQVAGVAVQVYSESLLAQKVSTSFDFIFDDYDWKRFHTFQTYTLDGTTGRATTTVADTFKQYDDIRSIYLADSNSSLCVLPSELNPAFITGGVAKFYIADQINTFRVLPITATGNIVVTGKLRPAEFALDSIVPFDSQALIMFTAWQYCLDDASNPAMIDKFQKMFDTRIEQLKNNQTSEPISLSMLGQNRYLNQWTE